MDLSPNGQVVETFPEFPAETDATYRRLRVEYRDERRQRLWAQGIAAGVLGLLLLGVGWQLMQTARLHPIQPFVTVIKVLPDGREDVQEPVAQRDYKPSEQRWRSKVVEWVWKTRWLSGEAPVNAAHQEWVALHTCPGAWELLQPFVQQEGLWRVGKRKNTIDLLSVTKRVGETRREVTAWEVVWQETTTEGYTVREPVIYTGTFTLGRLKSASVKSALWNGEGICVTGFYWERQQRVKESGL